MTVPVTGRIGCRFSINAKVARAGTGAAMRDLVFGKNVKDGWRTFEVDVPAQ
jgi:hypothetical protein